MARLYKGNELLTFLEFIGDNEIVKVHLEYDGGETDAANVIAEYLKSITSSEELSVGTLFVFMMSDGGASESWLTWVFNNDGSFVITNLYNYYVGDIFSLGIRKINLNDVNTLKVQLTSNVEDINKNLNAFKEEMEDKTENQRIEIDKQQKEIENLKLANEGKTYTITTDVDYRQGVPENALTYASVLRLSGYSVGGSIGEMQNAMITRIVSQNTSGEIIDTLEIPQEILDLDSYGMGNSRTSKAAHNYVDVENMVYHQNCKQVILDGSDDELWETRPNYANWDRYVINLTTGSISVGAVATDFTYVKTINDLEKQVINNNNSQIIVNFAEKGTTTLEQFKAWLKENPITIVYKLTEVIETDISHIPFDPFIKVEAGGIITFENECDLDNRSQMVYQVKVV